MRIRPATSYLLASLLSCVAAAGDQTVTDLADAVEHQNVSAVVRMLAAGTDVNASQNDGMTALHWAVYHDNAKVVKKLLSAGANATVATKFGITPLTIACQNGSGTIVQLLLEHGADPNTTRDGDESVLATAARAARPGPVTALLTAGALINRKDKNGQTALMWAAAAGNARVVKVLLDNNADQTVTLPSGFTALSFAVRNGHTDVATQLINEDTDINQTLQKRQANKTKSATGMSLLMLAIENAHYELAVMLLRAGADPNDDRTGFAPLHALSWVRKPEIGDNARGNPPPRGSGELTSLEFAKALVEHGADVNFPKRTNGGGRLRISVKGSTPFLCAASTADVAYMKTLIELGADPTAKNSRNQNALFMAAGIDEGPNADGPGTAAEHFAAVKYLLELDVNNLDEIDSNNQSVMHAAAYKSLPNVVHLFDQNGANIDIWNCRNKQGRTPLDIARGYRPGNFKPDFATENAIKKVMQKHQVKIPTSRPEGEPEDWDP